MIQKALLNYHLPQLTCVGLILFMLVFIGALIWVLRAGSVETYTRLSNLPLEEHCHE